jgi:biotin-(acetyl-CoA carboxylase) ligase
MPAERHSRIRTPYAEALNLPPPFRLVTLREVGDAFSHATSIAGPDAAGTLVWVGRFDLVEFALVLEPEEALRTARRVHYAGMVALADALATHAPPEKPISFDWPDTVRVDGGLVGGGRLAWPADAAEDVAPDWLVFGATIRTVAMGANEPGLFPFSAALEDEGFDGLESGRLVESFARHFMLALDNWHENGFAAVAREYIRYLAPERGARRDIETDGDLTVRPVVRKEPERRPLAPALLQPAWLDPATGGPRA